MGELAIRAEGVGKKYRIGARQKGYQTLRESLSGAVCAPYRALRSSIGRNGRRPDAEHIWALKDVAFEVAPGEVIGIIGRNGAGKSTLLKILSRITAPTEGWAEIRGRVGSLLEVGTGFHPELTGRENIYLNGAILGMRRMEIDQNFDAIVDFSEVEKFIDTPVKHYSSGMYLRLAFGVAAHLRPEVLLVDEVLAVGDASFQRKCLGKMQDVSEHGRTVLFVSHNMPAITRICKRTILLDNGSVLRDGPTHEVVKAYLNSGLGTTAHRTWADDEYAPGNEVARLLSVRVHTESGQTTEALDIRRPIGIEMEYEVLQDGHMLVPNYHFFNEEGVYVFVAHDHGPEYRAKPRPRGRYLSTAWIPGNLLSEGTLIVGAALSTLDPVRVHFYERDAVAFQVIDTMSGDSARGDFGKHYPGVVRPLLEWTNQYQQREDSELAGAGGSVAR